MIEPHGLRPVARGTAALVACVLAAASAAADTDPVAAFLEVAETCMAAAEANSAAPFADWPAEAVAPSLCGVCAGQATRFTQPGTGNRVTLTEVVHPALGAVLSCEMNLVDVPGGRAMFDDQPATAFDEAAAWMDARVAEGRLYTYAAPLFDGAAGPATASGTWYACPDTGRHYEVTIAFFPFPAALGVRNYPADYTMCALYVS